MFDFVFSVAENSFGLEAIRLFGEELLHVELTTDYGKKEFVCGKEKQLLNHTMLKSPFGSGEIERRSFFAEYNVSEDDEDEIEVPEDEIGLTLTPQDGSTQVQCFVNLTSSRLDIIRDGRGICLTLVKATENND